jgi:predicted phosphodiesterase
METKATVLEKAVALCETKAIRTVARNLHEFYPEFFPSLESARGALRMHRGALGEKNRRFAKVEEPKLSTIAEGLSKLKSQEPEDDLEITITGAKVGIVNDIHIPYHDPVSLRTALEYLKAQEIDALILNGDIIDFYGISRFTREIGRMTVQKELHELHGFLTLLRREFPNVRIVYKIGNHEERMRAYLLNSAKDVADLDALKIENLLGCNELGIEVVRRNRIMLGRLSVLHGHELPHGIAAPVNPARGVYLRTKASTLVGHHHQISNHSESDLDGNRTACWSTGCLCQMRPEYNTFAYVKWSHGFAVVNVDEDGRYHVQNHQIIDGRVY